MAKATAGPRKTTRNVTLKLTEGEAELLLSLVSNTAGHTSKSPRKYATRIRRALEGVLGYEAIDTDAHRLSLGYVTFFDYDDHPDIPGSARTLAYLESAGLQAHAAYYGDADDTAELLSDIIDLHLLVEEMEASRGEVSR